MCVVAFSCFLNSDFGRGEGILTPGAQTKTGVTSLEGWTQIGATDECPSRAMASHGPSIILLFPHILKPFLPIVIFAAVTSRKHADVGLRN